MTLDKPIVLFDGVCNFCAASVQFVLRNESKTEFLFSPLQSTPGLMLLGKYQLNQTGLSSIVLIYKNKAYRKSAAALHIARLLKFPWPLLYCFIIIPSPIRDWGYDFIGNRRYRWFGKKNECWIPDDGQLKSRFITTESLK